MRFIIGKLNEEEFELLKRGESVISKLLLLPDDFSLFHYTLDDEIEAETPEGNRIWTTIRSLEIVENESSVIVILTLVRARPSNMRDERSK